MKVHSLIGLAASVLLSSCGTSHHHGMTSDHHHMDMSRMCDMHRQMMAGKSQAEQQAAIEAHVESMHGKANPEMVAMHRRMMEQHCGSDAAAPK